MKSRQAFGLVRRPATTGLYSASVSPYSRKKLGHFLCLDLRLLTNFGFLPRQFAPVVLNLAPCGQITAKAHGDRAGGDFSKARRDYNVGRTDGTRDARRQGEGNRQSVGHADHDVFDRVAASEVFFPVIKSIHAEQRRGERWREQGISGRWAGLVVSGQLSVISDRWPLKS